MTTESPRRRPRKRRPAVAARILVTGISTAAMLGMIGGFGLTAPSYGTAPPAEPARAAVATAPPRPRPTIIIRVVRRRAQPVAPTQVVRQVVRRAPASGSAPAPAAPAPPPDTTSHAS